MPSVHPLALRYGLTREQISHAIDHGEATMAIGNGPTMILILGEDAAGEMIEVSCVIRGEDVLAIHAQALRPAYRPLLELAHSLPGADGDHTPAGAVDGGWGRSVDGLELTEQLAVALNDRAQRGHDYDVLRLRLRGGRPAPLAVGEVVRVHLDDRLHDAAAAKADELGISLPELVRRAVGRRLASVDAA
ncbi:hypothetical protein [Herbiconiux daphne]|uniref:DUF111 family protein n=1 Tax=Herbiconiux daphne TaxID=2970914 RepID=A0ABT2H6N0_9MICO|nr:hypothetical protein [Herbiconiux daphne]MCS5735559.1 hypothetical protein [Herbiconiux daphne]